MIKIRENKIDLISDLKIQIIDYKNKIEDLKKQLLDNQKDKAIYELQKQINEQNIILDKIKETNKNS